MKDGGSLVAVIADEVRCTLLPCFSTLHAHLYDLLTIIPMFPYYSKGYHCWFLARWSWKR